MKKLRDIKAIITSEAFVYLSLFMILLLSVIAAGAAARFLFQGLPPVYEMEEYTPALTTKVYDVNNNLIHEFSIEKRTMVPLEEIPVDLQNGLISMEDRDFFKHPGFSIRGITRAIVNDLFTNRPRQGGSTLTQQLSRGVLLTQEKKIIRKIREIIIAVQIEHKFSKQEILQLYLNEIYLGGGVYGVKSAALYYFNKEMDQLTTGEAAMIVGLIPSPGRYNPFANPERARQRRDLVLRVMYQQGHITEEIMNEAMAEALPEKRPVAQEKPGLYFIEQVRRILEPKFGMSTFWKAGLNIYTTVDIEKQRIAEEIIEAKMSGFDIKIAQGLGIEIPEFSENAEYAEEDASEQPELPDYPKLQAAFMARDVKTGAVRILVGGRDFGESKFNRATQSRRQPGSSFKPYVWMAALQKGYTPATQIKDLQTVFYNDGRNWRTFDEDTDLYSLKLASQPFVGGKYFEVWVPQNMGGRSSGWVTLRRALEKSMNLAAVNLIDAVGPAAVIRVARAAGVKSAIPSVPAIALGSAALTLDEHLAGLTTFGNGGIYTENYFVERVEDKNGLLLYRHNPVEKPAFTPQDAYLMINMMQGVVQRGTGTAARSLGRPLAGKTGTSQNHRDMWFVGMTPDIAAAAWMGYDDDTAQAGGKWTGGGTVAPWWTEIMAEVLKDAPKTEFAVPEGISFAFINPTTGKLATPSDKEKFLEVFKKGTEPKSF